MQECDGSAMLSGAPLLFSVMLSEAKHPDRTGFLTAFGMTKKSVRNDTVGFVMLNEVKHPHRTGFLATLGMTRSVLSC